MAQSCSVATPARYSTFLLPGVSRVRGGRGARGLCSGAWRRAGRPPRPAGSSPASRPTGSPGCRSPPDGGASSASPRASFLESTATRMTSAPASCRCRTWAKVASTSGVFRGRHALHGDRVPAADRDRADPHRPRRVAGQLFQVVVPRERLPVVGGVGGGRVAAVCTVEAGRGRRVRTGIVPAGRPAVHSGWSSRASASTRHSRANDGQRSRTAVRSIAAVMRGWSTVSEYFGPRNRSSTHFFLRPADSGLSGAVSPSASSRNASRLSAAAANQVS